MRSSPELPASSEVEGEGEKIFIAHPNTGRTRESSREVNRNESHEANTNVLSVEWRRKLQKARKYLIARLLGLTIARKEPFYCLRSELNKTFFFNRIRNSIPTAAGRKFCYKRRQSSVTSRKVLGRSDKSHGAELFYRTVGANSKEVDSAVCS